MGCVNGSGLLLKKHFTKDDWRGWVRAHPPAADFPPDMVSLLADDLMPDNTKPSPPQRLEGYTLEEIHDVTALHGIDLEQELADSLQEEIAKEIEENGSKTWAEICEDEKNV